MVQCCGIIILLIISLQGLFLQSVFTQDGEKIEVLQKYTDVFLGSQSGKPTLGTTKGTCWARGGICVHIQSCPSLKIDSGVAGCANAFRVCCKVFHFGSPTIGPERTQPEIPIFSSDFEELQEQSIEALANMNSQILRLDAK